MAAPLNVQTLLDRNTRGLSQHQRIPTFAEIGPDGAPHIAVVTCADPRCIPENFLHLSTGEVIIFRNPGGNAVAALPGLLALDNLLKLSDIIVIKHTDCGGLMYRDDVIKKQLKDRAPHRAADVDTMTFGNMTDGLEHSVRENLRYLKGSDYVRKELADRCVGFVYDIATGELKPVKD